MFLTAVVHFNGAVQCNAVQCNALQCNAVQCNAVKCSAGPFRDTVYWFSVVVQCISYLQHIIFWKHVHNFIGQTDSLNVTKFKQAYFF